MVTPVPADASSRHRRQTQTPTPTSPPTPSPSPGTKPFLNSIRVAKLGLRKLSTITDPFSPSTHLRDHRCTNQEPRRRHTQPPPNSGRSSTKALHEANHFRAHLLLYGPPGTRKTSTILAVARKLYGSQYRNLILEFNASDDRGIDVVRQQIVDFASARSLSFSGQAPVKLVLLDEADAMTKDAQFALRRVIEKHTKSTRFAFICNHVNKIRVVVEMYKV